MPESYCYYCMLKTHHAIKGISHCVATCPVIAQLHTTPTFSTFISVLPFSFLLGQF